MNKSWRQIKLEALSDYGRHYEAYRRCDDDRLVYANLYRMMAAAIISLPEDPPVYVRCAMARQLNRDMELLDAILERFEGRRDAHARDK